MDLLHQLVTRQAERRPDKTAVVLGDERKTYEELERDSNRLARALQTSGCRKEDRVALLLPKSPTAIVAMLAVLKCDAAYVPLDVMSPAARLERIVTKAEPRFILAGGNTGSILGDLDGVASGRESGPPLPRAGWLGPGPAPEGSAPLFGPDDVSDQPDGALESTNGPSALAHILFTSGSTGLPKGVVITHSNVLSFLEWARDYFGITEEDRASGHSPFHFDLSTFDIYGTLSAGAELHLVPPKANLLPSALGRLIRDAELTQWFSVPSAMSYMASAEVIRENDFPFLQRVLWCGEVLPTPVLIHWMERVPHPTYTNLYGPTEATIASTYHTASEVPTDPAEPIPIGRACGGEEALVLDGELRPLPPEQVGDIYLAGVGLSPGYWRDEEKTREAFVAPPDTLNVAGGRAYQTGDLGRIDQCGILHYVGRADTQIKSRGHRIELGEIEAALGGIEDLSEYAVVAIPADGFEGMSICCAYGSQTGEPVEPKALKGRLRRHLPSYMLPQQWLQLDTLPKNANGKIDRNALKERFSDAAQTA